LTSIKFGTDGWRGVIAKDYTFANVEIVSQAIADYVKSQGQSSQQKLLVGYDTRFLANQFAQRVAEVLAGNGLLVDLLDRPFPTPYVSYEVKRRKLAGGVMVTASHNPPEFCGIKFKAPFGGSATPAIVKEIERSLFLNPVQRADAPGLIRTISPEKEYFEHIQSLIRFDLIRQSGLRVIADPMHGTADGLLQEILGKYGVDCRTIREKPDPLFGGVFPEPMEENLGALKDAILGHQADIGLATDGDADRLGVMDALGNYVNTHQILALLILHLVRNRGWTGKVVKTFSQSILIERICRKLGLEFHVVPIGFKNIADLMLREDILIGGEESGGVGTKNHIPERDGILVNLLMLEAVAQSGKSLRQMVLEMWQEFGEFHFERRDLHVPLAFGQDLVQSLRDTPPEQFAGFPVLRVDTLDGSKLVFQDESWILFRQSGTEPLLRLYSEAATHEKVKQLMDEGNRLAIPG
jgi:phosphomannomutase